MSNGIEAITSFAGAVVNATELRLISDGDVILRGETLLNIGADTVVVFNVLMNMLYICAHLKDYKPLEDATGAFTKQMNALLNIVHGNKDKQIVLMLDANTEFEIEGNILSVFSKNGEKERKKFVLEAGVTVSGIISEFPTSNKMRGVHTAQLNKSLEPVSATIDHVLVFNGPEVVSTSTYTLNVAGNLNKVRSNNMLTTSSNSIVDHTFVISRVGGKNSKSYGTLNIKGGDVEDKAWAEFVPEKYYDVFNSPSVVVRLDDLLMETFKDYNSVTLAEIKSKNFLSTPRCGIFDINLASRNTPYVTIDGKYPANITITINSNGSTYVLVKNAADEYVKPVVDPSISEWVDILLNDLNSKSKDYECRKFLIDRGHLLLNYWHAVQNDHTELFKGTTLSGVFDEWCTDSSMKVSIGEMLRQSKIIHPTLDVISLQEMPKDQAKTELIIADIKHKLLLDGHAVNVYMLDTAIGSTRGAIVVFN